LPIGRSGQGIEIKQVISSDGRAGRKKRESILRVCLQKLLKTRIEKMSVLGAVQKLMKNKLVKNFLRICY